MVREGGVPFAYAQRLANLDLELGVGDVVGALGAQLVEGGIRRRRRRFPSLVPPQHPPFPSLPTTLSWYKVGSWPAGSRAEHLDLASSL